MSKIQAKGQNGHFRSWLNEENDKITNSDHLLPLNQREKREKKEKGLTVG